MNVLRRLLGFFGRNARREPRFKIRPLHRITLEARLGTELVKIPAANISTLGIGLVWDRPALAPRARFEVKLAIDGKEFVTRLEARHQTKDTLGCLFVDSTARLAPEIRRYLQIEMRAIELLRVDEKQLKADQRGKTHWFTDGGQSEIYFITKHERVVYFHLSFLGLYVEGGEREHLRTGRVSASAGGVGPLGYNPASLLDIDQVVDLESLALGARLVESAESLPEPQREQILTLLKAKS